MTPMLVLAWRNVFRNRRRSFITVGIISASLAALLILWAFLAGANVQAVESSTAYLTGQMQLAATGFFDEHGVDRTLPDVAAAERVLRASPAVRGFSPRVDGLALVSVDEETRPIAIVGIDPVAEQAVTRLHTAITSGRYLRPGDGNAVVLSQTLADQLQVAPGGEIILLANGAAGALGVEKFAVVGLFNTFNHDIDRAYGVIPLDAARELYSLGTDSTTIVVTADPAVPLRDVATELRAQLGNSVDVRTWDQLLPQVAQSVAFHEAVSYMILLIVLVLVAIGVSNTMLVSVLERTPEWGAILALGTPPAQLIRLVLLEGLLIGALGLPLGLVVALVPIEIFARIGLDLSHLSAGLEALPAHAVTVYPALTWEAVVFSAAIVLVVSLLAALYPALTAARMEPIEALRNLRRAARPMRGRAPIASTRFLMLSIAARNLMRNPGRSQLVAGASAIGVLGMLVMYGLIDGFFQQIVDNSTRYFTADVQIGRSGFERRDPSPQYAIEDTGALQEALAGAGIAHAAARRVMAPALVSTTESSHSILIMGVEPEREAQVTSLHTTVRDGAYLEAGDDDGILLGRKLAESLHARVGGRVVVTGQAADGELAAGAFRVRGLLETGSEAFDDTLALISLPAAQALLAMPGRISVVAVRLEDRDDADAFVEAVAPRLERDGLAAVPWSGLVPESEQILEMAQAVFGIVLFIAFSVTAVGNMNTILMSIMERKREIGTLLALGTSPARVVRLVVYESTAVVVAGAAVGAALGVALTLYLGWRGVDITEYVRSFARVPGITSMVYPALVASHAVAAVAGLLLVNVLASLYPAWIAARLDPVQNLRR